MRLPAELIDHIFGFLTGDISALKSYSEAHPSISQLAERHLFTDIGVGTTDGFVVSEIYDKLSREPRLLHYPRTLTIFNDTRRPDSFLREMLTMIPRMANLVSLKLSASEQQYAAAYYDLITVSTLRDSFQQLPLEQICLVNFPSFPLSILDNCKNIKKLAFSGCTVINVHKSKSPHELLEELSIQGCLDINLFDWITGRVANLKSLLLDVHWTSFPELLSACSSSLTRLHIAVPSFSEDQESWFLEKIACVWIRGDQRFPFNLSEHKCLKQLFISSKVLPTENGPVVGFDGAFTAITNLIKTAPAIQEVVLDLHWVDPTPGSLGRLDYSDHCPGISRIHLCISGDHNKVPISPTSILEALAEDEALMDLVGRGVVILKPSYAPLLDVEF